MMTWHLKDRTLEKAFEAYSEGKFVDALNYAVKHKNIDSEFIVYVGFVRECLGDDSSEICLCFKTDELEDIPEYNPHAWNDFPEVTPPEGVWMRLELRPKSGGSSRVGAKYVNGKWFLYYGSRVGAKYVNGKWFLYDGSRVGAKYVNGKWFLYD